MSERPTLPFAGDWPRLGGLDPGQAAWNSADRYVDPPAGVDDDPEFLLYVAVDTVFGSDARIVVSRWPKIGQKGRLTFGRTVSRWVNAKEFGELVSQHRVAAAAESLPDDSRVEFLLRPIVGGDVFAISRRDAADLDRVAAEPQSWIRPPVTDITAEMRVQAKLAYYAAVAPVLPPQELRRVQGDEESRA